ncbi:thioredoxin-dependent thiol peroxidase [Candidatus Finniella inopinata]|uniref:thioredoxin-dependent peroxiredoxin n=1 Tax=Candidatus Finniella inopinata TaxID=1696036 RepID=A0A4V2DZZ3_9PROT|nr:thioredoxin-dependent thiol peroxidase [Candidatus Finniella inopinata]RZI46757.1 thioredoxin-dependent thiol peroxidase [Candidatus Finniella inopinata]
MDVLLDVGSQAPDFSLMADNGDHVTLSQLKGEKIILYFYPKDDTSGCTQQACDFRDHQAEFAAKGAVILGISRDSNASHQKFKSKHTLNFPLLTDEDGKVCEAYGVWKEKSMYGKTYFGIDRSTFLIDENLCIQKIWRKVKVTDHFQEVLKAL